MSSTPTAYWNTDTSGDWSSAANWTVQTGQGDVHAVPGANDAVVLTPTDPAANNGAGQALGQNPFTVRYSTTDTVDQLTAPGFATLAMAGGRLTVNDGLTFAGTLQLSGGTLAVTAAPGVDSTVTGRLVATGGTLAVNGGRLVLSGGGSAGAGGLAVAGGATLDVDEGGTGATLALGAGTLAGSGTVMIGNGGVVALGGNAVTVAPAVVFGSGNGTVSGTGRLVLAGGLAFELYAKAVMTGGGTTVLQGATVLDNDASLAAQGNQHLENQGTFTWRSGQLSLGSGTAYNGYLANDAGATFDIQTDGLLAASGQASAITNAGLFEKSAGGGLTDIAPRFTNAAGATVRIASGRLAFDAAMTNAGTVDVEAGTQLMIDTSLANLAGGTIRLDGDVGIGTGSGTPFDNAGTLAKTAGTGTSQVLSNFGNTTGAAAAITVASGTLEFDGADVALVRQAVSGAGTLLLRTFQGLIGPGTTIASAGLRIDGNATTVKLGEDLSYAGAFAQAGNLLNLSTHSLSLTGPASFAAKTGNYATLVGTGTLAVSGDTAVSGLNILGDVQFRNTGTVTQTGTIGVGDTGNGAAAIINAAGATWTIGSAMGIAADSARAAFVNDGALVKAGGTGTSVIRPALTSSQGGAGTVTVAQGGLELQGLVSGHETLGLDAGATLILDAGAGADAAIAFKGDNATLRLGDPAHVLGTIQGFAGHDALGLPSVHYAGQAATYTGTADGGTLSVSDGTHTASLNLIGHYGAASFHLAADPTGGTLIGLA